ncbi:Cellulose-binding protein [Pseudohyphozyma bogoriensis]|nr:Cellulose-binding protein [Pseudohyphozyma bogoriensis]
MATSASFEELPDIVDSPEHSDDDEDAVEELLYGAQVRTDPLVALTPSANTNPPTFEDIHRCATLTLGLVSLFFSGIRSTYYAHAK